METIKKFSISLITLLFISVATSDECIKCVHREKCEEFGKLNKHEQEAWKLKYPCPNSFEQDEVNGAAKGDYVCCPSALQAFYYRQSPIIGYPPRPESGSCGREATKTDGTNVPDESKTWRSQMFPDYNQFFVRRTQRSAENVTGTPEKRIIGGTETELEQYPWTALVRKKKSYYGRETSWFHCGGSLISSRYVLTAGHCVYESSEGIAELDVVLAEYDKRAFPKDCKLVFGQGRKCIENVVMKVEKVILYPEYNENTLKNDIALLRLKGNAPYTNYIRPICLPSMNVDSTDSVNLHLAVAGWGSNGPYNTHVKQSTVVNLVPHKRCQRAYLYLSRGQMCAVGYNGEDTCPGDSGGPLMAVNNGQFEVVGIVSGKRRDVPCGTAAVPSLYTNVYYYLDWIHSIIRN